MSLPRRLLTSFSFSCVRHSFFGAFFGLVPKSPSQAFLPDIFPWPHSHFLVSGIPFSERFLASFQNFPLRHSSPTYFLGLILIFLCQAFPSLSTSWPHSKISLSGIPPRHISLASFPFSCVRHSSPTYSLGLIPKSPSQAFLPDIFLWSQNQK